MLNDNLRILTASGGNIELVGKQGTTWGPLLIYLKSDSLPLDLTGYSVRGQIRKSIAAIDTIDGLSLTITNESGGELSISMTAEDSALIPAGPSWNHADSIYVWDVEIYKVLVDDPLEEEVYRFFGGKLYIDPEVTRSA